MPILCSLTHLNLSYGTKTIFRDTGLTINLGDKIGLIGPNGKGKSSLLKTLTGQLTPDISDPPFRFVKTRDDQNPEQSFTVFFIPQEIPLDSKDSVTLKNFIFRFYPQYEKAFFELQKINSLLENPNQSGIEDLIHKQKELFEYLDHEDFWSLLNSYESYLKYFGLDNLDSLVVDLSGGEQKKILLSLGLTSRANLILWDEPTNHLDLESIKLFEGELANVNKAYILISHDRYLLSKLTSKVFHLRFGKVEQYNGSYADYLKFLSDEETTRKKLFEKISNNLRRETDWMRQGIKARGCRSKKRVENYFQLKETLQDIKSKARKSMDFQMAKGGKKTKKLAEFKGISFGHSENSPLFEDLNLTIMKGDKIGLLGPNGVGKTSLVNIITEELRPNKGELYKGPELVIQYFSQKREELSKAKTPYDLLGQGTDSVSLPDGNKKHVTSYMESFLFSREDVHRPIETFSGGEKNRLQLAYNLTLPGDLWIFDEPTNDLDLETLELLEKKLEGFDGSVILISHDRAFLSSVTNKIWLLNNRKIEEFNGGYSQAEPYLEALIYEQQLQNDDEEQEETEQTHPLETEKSQEQLKKKKLSNPEKIRLKNLPSLIKKGEKELEEVQHELSSFDYSQMDQDKTQRLQDLNHKQGHLEEEILGFYEELEDLESRV